MSPPDIDSLIVKKTLYAGRQSVPFKDGTKIYFHFQTRRCDPEKTLLDDSRKMGKGKPMELVLGKQFKLEVWEVILQKMALNEVAEFRVDKSLVHQYPFISKTLRDLDKPPEERKTHYCAMSMQNSDIGYPDLNVVLKYPQDLEFTMEIVKVEQPEDYEKETWQMNENEQLELIPKLREQGNEEFKKKNYKKAGELYAKAIGILENFMLREKPHDVEWNAFNQQKIPFLLNYAQCKLFEGDYYAVIEHCTTVINADKDNLKAHFRRAKAHVAAWNPEAAKADFNKVMELDKNLIPAVKKELANLEVKIKEKAEQDKEKLKKLFK